MGKTAKYVMVVLVAIGMSVVMQSGQVLGQGMPGHHGPMGAGSFSFERLIGGFGGKVVTGAPFSAQVTHETTQVLSDGTHVDRKVTGNIARDSSGRTRQEMILQSLGPLSASGHVPHIAFIRDPGAGKSYILNEDKKTAMTITRGNRANQEGHGNMKSRRDDANVQTESLGTKTLDGLTVQGTRKTRTIPAGQIGNDKAIVITTEEWYSPDLQMVVSSTRTDPRFGTTTLQLTSISRDEPSQSMFTVPSDYTEAQMGRHGGARMAPPNNNN